MAETETLEVTEATEETTETTEATETKETTETILEAEPEDKPVAAPADWPENWRNIMAGDDAKELKRLERFNSPIDVHKSFRSLEGKFSDAKISNPLPEDASDEDIAAWRKENGIPEDVSGYLDKLPDGLVVGEDDKPMAESFATAMHEINMPPEMFGQAYNWYTKFVEESTAQQVEADAEFQREAVDQLRAEWGSEYRKNINTITSFLDQAPAADDGTSMKEMFFGGRLADGTPIGDNPAILRWLSGLASTLNPAGIVIPAEGKTHTAAIEDEIAEIESLMRTNRAAYNKDEKKQKRLLELYDAQEKMKSRAA